MVTLLQALGHREEPPSARARLKQIPIRIYLDHEINLCKSESPS